MSDNANTDGELDRGVDDGADADGEVDADDDHPDLSSTTLTQRLVLLGVIHTARGGGPVHSAAVVDAVVDHLDDIDADMIGSVNEAEAVRALNRLSADGYLGEEITDASPAGKGRPTYALAVDERHVLDAFAEDHRLDEVVAFVRDA